MFVPDGISHMKRLTSIGYLVLALLIPPASAMAQDAAYSQSEQQLLALINQERAKEGVPPLVLDVALTQAARKHAALMAQDDSVVHQLPDEEPLALRVRDEHVRCDHDGENIALAGDVDEAHVLLMHSPAHRANVLNPKFNSVGIGITQDGQLTYVTEDFAHVLPSYSETEADAAVQKSIAEFAQSQSLPAPVRKPRPQLSQMACDMANEDKLDGLKAQNFAGARSAVAWTASDLGQLPTGAKKMLSQPLTAGYALGVCFAPSATYPSGVYWLVMVVY